MKRDDATGMWWKRPQEYVCESCKELYLAWPEQNCRCLRCGMPHSLCDACWSVHNLSETKQFLILDAME